MRSLHETIYATRVVERAIDVLFCLAQADRPSRVADVASRLKLSRATAFRLLHTLIGKGLVRRGRDEATYALDARVLSLAARFLPHQLTAIARPYLEQLRDASGETATLCVRIGDERIFVDVVPSRQEVRMVPEVGRLVPLVRGASGKILLAFAEIETRTRLLRGGHEGRGTRETKAFEVELDRIQRDGHAHSVEERTPGAGSVAAAVRDRDGVVRATVAVSAPVSRFTGEIVAKLLPLVLQAADRISHELGYRPEEIVSGRSPSVLPSPGRTARRREHRRKPRTDVRRSKSSRSC